jgi:hypothetical protein
MSETTDAVPPLHTQETGSQNTAEKAFRIFGQAAALFSGSGTAQAAFIAKECKEQDLQASSLSVDLLNRNDLLQKIITMGNRAHEAKKKEVNDTTGLPKWKKVIRRMLEKEGPPPVTQESAKETIKDIFSKAQRMHVLDPDELAIILKEYPQAIANTQLNEYHVRSGEDQLRQKAEFMIESHTSRP